MTATTRTRLCGALRVLLGLLLLWAAVSKLANPTDFLASIYAYQLPLPARLTQFVAVVLPWFELLCGLLLLAKIWPETALLSTAALFVVFVLATGQAWARGLNISCGCFDLSVFGLGEKMPGLVKLLESVGFAFVRNLLLTAGAFYLLRTSWLQSGKEIPPVAARMTRQQRRAAAM